MARVVRARMPTTQHLTVRTEIRDLIYYEDFRAGDTSQLGSALKQSVRNQIMGTLGISFFIPTTFERE